MSRRRCRCPPSRCVACARAVDNSNLGLNGWLNSSPVLNVSSQAAALRALGRLALLSEPLSRRAVQIAEACLRGGSGTSRRGASASLEPQLAAVTVLADAAHAFPNAYSDRLALLGRLMAPREESDGGGSLPAAPGTAAPADSSEASAADVEEVEAGTEVAAPAETSSPAAAHPAPPERLARAAAAAYCRLLLSDRLRLQSGLGPVGAALVHGSPSVVAVVRHALAQLLAAAAPKERARLCMAAFHQAPPACRAALATALTDPAGGLLGAADLRGGASCSVVCLVPVLACSACCSRSALALASAPTADLRPDASPCSNNNNNNRCAGQPSAAGASGCGMQRRRRRAWRDERCWRQQRRRGAGGGSGPAAAHAALSQGPL